jgi:feruloyl esterase
MHALRGPLLGNAEFDLEAFTATDVTTVRSSWLAGVYEAKNPDISQFVKRGGRLLLWHGINDPGPSFRNTVEYYDEAMQATAGAAEGIRLFLAPGVAHCRGGAGPDRIDWLSALERWVENNHAPEQLPATKAESTLKWDVCAYPALPTGQADGSYSCQ